jgi:hypothetical protein
VLDRPSYQGNDVIGSDFVTTVSASHLEATTFWYGFEKRKMNILGERKGRKERKEVRKT